MSKERRERQQARTQELEPKHRELPLRQIAIAAVIIGAFAAAYYLGYHKRAHKYDAFARCLKDRGVKMYGAFWCPHCADQKAMFDASFDYAPYVECGVKGQAHAETQECADAGIKNFPTWQFPPTGERVERVLSLDELSERTACRLP
jgi:hypothetical protein